MAQQYSSRFEKVGRYVTRHAVPVILVWLVIGGATNLAWPQLEKVTAVHAVSPMPVEAPAVASVLEMAKAFGEDGIENSVIIAMSDPQGITPDARLRYKALADRLKADTEHVAFVQDLLSDPRVRNNPTARSQVVSEDGKAWFLLAGLKGKIGSAQTLAGLESVKYITAATFKDSAITAKVTGPTATVGDLAIQGVKDVRIIGIVTFSLIAMILLLVYRSIFTAGLPLLILGVSILVARGVVAGLGEVGLPLASTSSALMIAILSGASVNYTVFLISRYHERVRAGEIPVDAIAHASGSMGPVILATAATVAIANLAQLTAKLGLLAAAGPAIAIAIVIGFLVVMTMLPAVLMLAAKRGIGLPRKDITARTWRQLGVLTVRRPVLVFTASALILAFLASFVGIMRLGYDDRAAQPSDTESAEGYALMDAHFPKDSMVAVQYLFIRADKDIRTPQGLADLDQMAARVAQLPGINRVVGITRPDGNKLTQATLAWQLGMIGKQIARVGDRASVELAPQMARMTEVADVVSSLMGQFGSQDIAKLQATITDMMGMARQASTQFGQYQGLIGQLGNAAQILDEFDRLAPSLDGTVAGINAGLDAIEPVSAALESTPLCSTNEQCRGLQEQLKTLVNLRKNGFLESVVQLRDTVHSVSGGQSASVLVTQLSAQFDQIRGYMDQLPELEARYQQFNAGYEHLQALGVTTDSIASMGAKIRQLNSQAQQAMSGMTEAAAYLQTISNDASGPSASGFYLPNFLFQNADFQTAAKLFITADGKNARFMIQSSVNPYSAEAMDLANSIGSVANQATPNTSLAGAEVSVGGFPAVNSDLQTMFQRDFKEIIVVTLLIILAIMSLLLRAIVAPLYLLATVVVTYAASLGAGVLVFQVLLGEEIYWVVPAMTFVLVVAVGADYNMLFISRLREEGTRNIRVGVIRTVGKTGSVITSAGMLFAASMFGMMAGHMSMMLQMGFIIGFGILLDTFVVRTLMVPTLATLVGKASWWPSRA